MVQAGGTTCCRCVLPGACSRLIRRRRSWRRRRSFFCVDLKKKILGMSLAFLPWFWEQFYDVKLPSHLQPLCVVVMLAALIIKLAATLLRMGYKSSSGTFKPAIMYLKISAWCSNSAHCRDVNGEPRRPLFMAALLELLIMWSCTHCRRIVDCTSSGSSFMPFRCKPPCWWWSQTAMIYMYILHLRAAASSHPLMSSSVMT